MDSCSFLIMQTELDNYLNNCDRVLFMLSGGKDSAYTLWRLVNEYPRLDITALFVNNGFSSPVAMQNAVYLADKLGINLYLQHALKKTFLYEFKQAFLNLNNKGCYGIIDQIDGHLIFTIGRIFAAHSCIKTIISGMTWAQTQRILSIETTKIDESGIDISFPMAVWRTSESEIRQTVRDEKLMLPGTDSPIVSNSELVPVMAWLDFKNLGYSSFEPEIAQLVREGKADRKEYLYLFEFVEFAVRRGWLDKQVDTTLAKLGLTKDELV